MSKKCCFIGHRNVEPTMELIKRLDTYIRCLIEEQGVQYFLFGSRSKFDDLCHMVVTEMKDKYPHIQRVVYLCKHESGCLIGDGSEEKRRIKEITGEDVYVREFEKINKSEKVNSAVRAAYVERNEWMIDDSDVVIIYLEESQKNKKSGTWLMSQYASRRKKKTYIFEKK